MYNEGPVRGTSADGKVKQGCPYSGYTVFAGEAVLPLNDYYDVGYNVYIGPQRYFVKSDVGDGRVQWYAFCALPAGSAKAGDSWDEGATTSEQGRSVVDYIKGLHEGWSVFCVDGAFTRPRRLDAVDESLCHTGPTRSSRF